MATITGNGNVALTDFKTVKWTGVTKAGDAVEIELTDAINMGDIDWTFAEKNDTVPSITFTATYSNTDEASSSNDEPWSITVGEGLTGGAGEILLGAGVFSVGGKQIALTRGGGSFKVTREFRRINADGDRGAVKGRVVIDGSEATLTMNVLTMLTSMSDLYAGITTA